MPTYASIRASRRAMQVERIPKQVWRAGDCYVCGEPTEDPNRYRLLDRWICSECAADHRALVPGSRVGLEDGS